MYFNLGGDRSPDNIGGTLVYYFDEHFEANYSYYQSLLEIIIDTFHATNAHFCQRIYFSQNKFFPVPLKHGLERIGLINYYQKGFLLPPLPDYIKLENYKDKGTLFHIDKQVTFPLYTNFADYEAGKCPQFDNFTKKIRPVFEAFRNMYPNPLSKD